MSQFARYGATESPHNVNGDLGWTGVNMRLDPAALEPGEASEARNARFTAGVLESRRGLLLTPWANKIVGTEIQSWGNVYGLGRFRDPVTRLDMLIVATASGVFYVAEYNSARAIPLPVGVTISSKVEFTQANEKLLMDRGAELQPLELVSLTDGFRVVSQTTDGTGTLPIPPADRSLFTGGRVFRIYNRDEIAASDIFDYTRYEPTRNAFRVSPGDSDSLVALVKFAEGTLIAFKNRSIHLVTGVYGDLSDIRSDELTRQYGLVAPRSAIQAGSDLVFLSQLGVMSIRQTEQSKVQGVVVPLSQDIQPLIDRVNWQHAHKSIAAYVDNKLYLAIPLDRAEVEHPDLIIQNGLAVRYLADNTYTVPVVAGKTYRWTMDEFEVSIVNGSQTLTNPGYFVAQGSSVVINGDQDKLVKATLRRVDRGVLNAVLVYDFLNQKWAGHDYASYFSVADMLVWRYKHRERLFVLSDSGLVSVYDEAWQDYSQLPYTDVAFTSTLPVAGNTIRVNGGTTVTAAASSANSGNNWGVSDSGTYKRNLWRDTLGNPGYHPMAGAWTAPNTIPVSMTDRIRFYATNGVPPSVVTTGSWASVTSVRKTDIEFFARTRGYTSQGQSLLVTPSMVTLDVQTWAPSFSVSLIGNGAFENEVLKTNQTKSRLSYYRPFTAADWDPDNSNDDYTDPGRQDYSLTLGTGIQIGSGISPGKFQETRETFSVPNRGFHRAASVEISNNQGQIRVLSCLVAGPVDQTQALVKDR